MGLFTSLFQSTQETRDQKRQRVLTQATASDRDIRFSRNFHRIHTSFMNDSFPDSQKGDPDAVLYMYVLIELRNEAFGKMETQSQLKSNFLAVMGPYEFERKVNVCKDDIFRQFSDLLRHDLKDPESAQILEAQPKGSYIQVFRRGLDKTIQLFEQNGLHEEAQEMRKMWK